MLSVITYCVLVSKFEAWLKVDTPRANGSVVNTMRMKIAMFYPYIKNNGPRENESNSNKLWILDVGESEYIYIYIYIYI